MAPGKEEEGTAATTPQVSQRSDLPNARYYDFEDIQIPNELSMNADKSKIFQTPNMTAGVLVPERKRGSELVDRFF